MTNNSDTYVMKADSGIVCQPEVQSEGLMKITTTYLLRQALAIVTEVNITLWQILLLRKSKKNVFGDGNEHT